MLKHHQSYSQKWTIRLVLKSWSFLLNCPIFSMLLIWRMAAETAIHALFKWAIVSQGDFGHRPQCQSFRIFQKLMSLWLKVGSRDFVASQAWYVQVWASELDFNLIPLPLCSQQLFGQNFPTSCRKQTKEIEFQDFAEIYHLLSS